MAMTLPVGHANHVTVEEPPILRPLDQTDTRSHSGACDRIGDRADCWPIALFGERFKLATSERRKVRPSD